MFRHFLQNFGTRYRERNRAGIGISKGRFKQEGGRILEILPRINFCLLKRQDKMVRFDYATLKFDGSCRPNPGEGGSGYIFEERYVNQNFLEGQYYVGHDATNNVAEYFGLIAGLRHLADSNFRIGHLYIEGDSKLVIKQLNGNYTVTSRRMRKLHRMALQAIERGDGRDFDSYSFKWIDRGSNIEADRLANRARRTGRNWSASYEDYYANEEYD